MHSKPERILEQSLQAHPELRQRFITAERVKKVLATGPMAQRLRWPWQDGILFIGDAAGFFDPFTGQGIYLALQSAALAAVTSHQALGSGDVSASRLRTYFLAHHHAFHDKYRLSEVLQLGLRVPWLANYVIRRLAHEPSLADTVVGVTGDFLSPRTVLSWRFARRVLL
jgi:flavin-dependent dehydrogenase